MHLSSTLPLLLLRSVVLAQQCISRYQEDCVNVESTIPDLAFCVLQEESIVDLIGCVGTKDVGVEFEPWVGKKWESWQLAGLDPDGDKKLIFSPRRLLVEAANETSCGLRCGLLEAFQDCPTVNNQRFKGCLCNYGFDDDNVECLSDCIKNAYPSATTDQGEFTCEQMTCLTKDSTPKGDDKDSLSSRDDPDSCPLATNKAEIASARSRWSEISSLTKTAFLPDATPTASDLLSQATAATTSQDISDVAGVSSSTSATSRSPTTTLSSDDTVLRCKLLLLAGMLVVAL